MTDDQIRRLGMEAGFFADEHFEPLKQFARRVIEADRQEAVQVIEDRFQSMLFRTAVVGMMEKIMREVVSVIEGERDEY